MNFKLLASKQKYFRNYDVLGVIFIWLRRSFGAFHFMSLCFSSSFAATF